MLAALTCFFNPVGYARPVENYFRFRQALGPVPLYTVELSFNDQFVIPDSLRIPGSPHSQVLWQKERLLNVAIEQLPTCFDKVAWIDGDLLFSNPHWYQQTEAALDQFPVVQMFEACHWLDASGHVEKTRPAAATLGSYFGRGTHLSHPGFAWAARRESLQTWGGLFDQDVTGSGDSWLTHGCFREFETPMMRNASPGLRDAALKWCQIVDRDVQRRVGHVPGDVWHLFHGSLKNRGYWDRFLLQRQHEFNPQTDIAIAPNKAWEWASLKPELHEQVRHYFLARQEDA